MHCKKVRLIIEGIKIFADSGFEDFKIKDVEKNARIRKGSFFEVFDTTEQFAKECYLYTVNSLLESNTQYIAKLEKGLTYDEISREVWFNTIAWWLNDIDNYYFFCKFRNSKYYQENLEFIEEAAKPYLDFSTVGLSKGYLKPIPVDFLYELVVVQIMNTVAYIQRYPTLISDSDFLALSFDSLWDSIKKRKN